MPGVVVTTATKIGGSGNTLAPSGQAFFVGLSERGTTTEAILVRSLADVARDLGNRPTYGFLWDQLKAFFDEGGRQAYVSRIVGGAAAAGTLSLNDRHAVTPVPTLKIDAANPGSWSSQLKVQVLDGTVTNTFRIIVTLNGEVVEDVTNIATPAEAVTKFASSTYVQISNLASATAAPLNNPAVLAATSLSAGTDDRAAVVEADYVSGLDKFVIGLNDGAVSIPGFNSATIVDGILAHCESHRRIGIIGHDFTDDDYDDAIALAADYDSEYLGIFGPYLQVSDGGGGLRTIPPDGFVAACRARAHLVGPWRVPAGQIGKALTVLDVVPISTVALDVLDKAKVSIIRKFQTNVRLYGWRSLSNDTDNYAYLKDRDVLNRLVNEAEARLEDYVFEPIDAKGQLLSAINAELVGMIDPIAQAGGLFPFTDDLGNEVDPGYRVETGSELNPRTSLAQNQITARLSVRVAPTGDLVNLTIVKVGLLSGI